MSTRRSRQTLILPLVLLLMLPGSVLAGWWQDLWQTPHQQASTLLQQQNYDQLKDIDDRNWQGIGHYHAGEHQQAAERFAGQENLDARYNEATALTHTGDYDRALELFDQVLAEDPAHEEAAHNRNIAQQLKELQQQQQQQQQNQNSEGENDEENSQDQSSSDDSSSPESPENSAEQNAGQDADQSEQQNADEQSADDEQDSGSDESDDESDAEESRVAGNESEKEPGEEEDTGQQQAQSAEAEEQPLSEQAQATEQWLRRIPDDPSGLLRRKLQRSHATDYPDIGNSESPW